MSSSSSPSSSSFSSSLLIQKGDSVVIVVSPGRQQKVVCLTPGQTTKVHKFRMELSQLIGVSYGTLFRLTATGKPVQVPRPPVDPSLIEADALLAQQAFASERTNFHLPSRNVPSQVQQLLKEKENGKEKEREKETAANDNNNAQRLSETEVIGLRDHDTLSSDSVDKEKETAANDNNVQRLSEAEVIGLRDRDTLSSDSVDVVEALKQGSASYESKTLFSQQKYLKAKIGKHVVMFEVRPYDARAVMLSEDRKGAMGFHVEALAQMMAHANVRSGGRHLVVDEVRGALYTNVLERMGGRGELHLVAQPLQAAGSQSHCSLTTFVRRPELSAPLRLRTFADIGDALRDMSRRPLHSLLEADSLLIATAADPFAVFALLAPFVLSSTPFAVFSPHAGRLIELRTALQRSTVAIRTRLSETFTRHYQVLPGRTHPEMRTKGRNGYLLTGILLDSFSVDTLSTLSFLP
jgi:tRNA (adenine58-N1)-methyltransferase non-catalytic subunit